jgi:hypothetical protein
MPGDNVLNSNQAVTVSSRDEEDLKALKLTDSDLDRFAAYFELAFNGSSRSTTVLVALLQRLRSVEKLRAEKQSGIFVEDIVGRLTLRLYRRCQPGFEAAARFGEEASTVAQQIFSEAVSLES